MTTLKYLGVLAAILIGFGMVGFLILLDTDISGEMESYEDEDWEYSYGECNIGIVSILGDITTDPASEDSEYYTTNADDVNFYINQMESDDDVDGILVRIDSYGGTPVASEIITNRIKNSTLPSVALIREMGASGGYMIATGADTIIASPLSDIGSIGVSMSYVGNWEQNVDTGLTYVPLTSAPFKDYMHPDKPLTGEERSLLERDLAIYHEYFVGLVAENRGLALEHVAELADGSSMPGALALEAGLIDQLGDQETAREWFAKELDTPADEVIFCE